MDIFKQMLVENPKVLAEFIEAGLTDAHIDLIGEMIQPPQDLEKRKRMFLYEVMILPSSSSVYFITCMHYNNNHEYYYYHYI